MKKTKSIGIAVVLLVFISAAVLFVNASSAPHASQGKNRDPITQSQPHQNPSSSSSAALSSPSPVEKGTEIGQKMKAVFDQNAKDKKSGSPQRDPDRVVGTVDGVDIHAKDVALKAALYQAVDSKHPLEDAWDVLKLQAYEKGFAQKHDLLPSANEMTQASQQMRKDAESSEDGKAFCDAIFQAMGMTADEYWNDYKPKYEMPADLIDTNVAKYDREHGLKPMSKKESKGKLKDPILLSEYPDPDQTADQ